ncbi:MAG TPA: outer membrane protein transport protein, partial [Bacteroidia bacterium]
MNFFNRYRYALIAIFAPGSVLAGGFQLNVQGQKGLAMGGGATALSCDASSVYFNPGGLNFLDKKFYFTGGTSLIFPNVSFQTAAVVNDNQTSPMATPLQIYATYKASDKISLGVGVNNQFGSVASFNDDWEGKYIVQKMALKTFMYQPTVAYKICDRIGIGAGFVYTTGAFEYKQAVPVATSSYNNGEALLSGKGVGFSYNAGIHGMIIKPDSSRLLNFLKGGISYRSPIKITIGDGTAAFSDISVALQSQFPAQTNFSTQLTLPGVYSFGLLANLKINNKINVDVLFDYNRTLWSSYDSLKIDFANPTTPDSKSAKNYKDVNAFRLGGS